MSRRLRANEDGRSISHPGANAPERTLAMRRPSAAVATSRSSSLSSATAFRTTALAEFGPSTARSTAPIIRASVAAGIVTLAIGFVAAIAGSSPSVRRIAKRVVPPASVTSAPNPTSISPRGIPPTSVESRAWFSRTGASSAGGSHPTLVRVSECTFVALSPSPSFSAESSTHFVASTTPRASAEIPTAFSAASSSSLSIFISRTPFLRRGRSSAFR